MVQREGWREGGHGTARGLGGGGHGTVRGLGGGGHGTARGLVVVGGGGHGTELYERDTPTLVARRMSPGREGPGERGGVDIPLLFQIVVTPMC